MPQLTAYPYVNELLHDLLGQIKAILGDKLVGLYLYGSLVWGDFDEGISDVDLLAVVSDDLAEDEFNALHAMQNEIVAKRPQWTDHIEIAYVSLEALQTFKTQSSQIAVISPGEPFHFKDAGRDWLVNWYPVREKGQTLFGPPPQSIIPPISKDEFIQVVKEHVSAWREWIDQAQHRGFQAYAILTLCRALYTCRHGGDQVSKRQAGLWAVGELPEWSETIQDAISWRVSKEQNVDDKATLPNTRRFVHSMIDHILGAG